MRTRSKKSSRRYQVALSVWVVLGRLTAWVTVASIASIWKTGRAAAKEARATRERLASIVKAERRRLKSVRSGKRKGDEDR